MSQNTLIESIRKKVAEVVADNRRLREQNAKLQQAGERLKADKMALQEQVKEAERRIGVLELSASLGGNAEQNKLARARVNRLMREVDRCILLINKQ